MKEINIYPIMGLYQELYNPDYKSMSESIGINNTSDAIRNINSVFWSEVLSENNITKLIQLLTSNERYVKFKNIKYKAILGNPNQFKKNVINSIKLLSAHSIDKKMFFPV